jgi:plasmid stabilization system protein ParE
MTVDWSDAALADLERFAEFLHREHLSLAAKVAAEIVSKVQVLAAHPRSPGGKSIARLPCWSSARLMCFSIGSMATA